MTQTPQTPPSPPPGVPERRDHESRKIRLPLLMFRLVRFSLFIFLGLIVIAVGLAAFFWVTESTYLARYLSRTVTQSTLRDGYVMRVGDIGGNPFGVVTVSDIWVGTADGDTCLSVDELRLEYPTDWAAKGELGLASASIVNPRLILREDADGDLEWPWREPNPRRPKRTFNAHVDDFVVANFYLDLIESSGTRKAIVRAFYAEGNMRTVNQWPRVHVARGSGDAPIAPVTIDWLTTDATLIDGDIVFTNSAVDVGRSHVTGSGRVTLQGDLDLAFQADLEHVDTDDVYASINFEEVLGNGQLHGTMSLVKRPVGVQMTWDVSGVLNDDKIDRIVGEGHLTLERFDIERVRVDALGSTITGTLGLDLIEPFNYVATANAENVDLSDLAIQGELVPLHPHRFNGRAKFSGRDYTLPYPDMTVSAVLGPSSYLGVPIDSAVATVRLTPGDLVTLESVVAWTGLGEARAEGTIVPDETCDVRITGEGIPLSKLVALHEQTDLRGSADFSARVTGDVLTPDVEASGGIGRFSVGSLALRRLEVPTVSGRLVPFDARVSVQGRTGTLGPLRIDRLDAVGVVSDTIEVEQLTASRLDTVLVASGRVVPDATGANGLIYDAHLTLPIGDAELVEPVGFRYGAGGVWDTEIANLVFADGEISLEVETERDGRRPLIRSSGRGVRLLDVLPNHPRISMRGGECEYTLTFLDDPDEPLLDVDARFDWMTIEDISLTDLIVVGRGEGDSLRVSQLEATAGVSQLTADLRWKGEGSAVRQLLAGDLRGFFAPDRRASGSARIDALDVDLVGRVRNLFVPSDPDTLGLTHLFTRDQEDVLDTWKSLSGRADVRVTLDGTHRHPSVRADVRSDSLFVRGQQLESVQFVGVYRDSLFTLSQFDVIAGGNRAQLSGFLPVDLDLSRPRARLLDTDMLVAVDMVETPLSLVSVLFPQLIVSEGSITGRGRFRGTPFKPSPEGGFDVTDGRFRWFGRTENLWNAKARVNLTNEGLEISGFEAQEELRGKARGSGIFRRLNDYRFTIHVEDFLFSEAGMLGTVDGTIHIRPDSTTAGRLLPRFGGDVRLRQGEIYEFKSQAGPEFSSRAIEALFDFDVEVDRLYVNTSDVYTTTAVTLGDGQLTVRNFPEALRIGGYLEVIEGGGTVYGNRFRVQSGGEIQFNEVDGVNPELDIRAEAAVRGTYARERGYDKGDAKIVAEIGGTLVVPEITLRAEPDDLDMSQTEIFEYLTVGRYRASDGSTSGLEPTTDILLSLLADDISDLFPFIDYVEVSSDEEARSVRLVKTLNDEWTIGYSTGVSSSPDQELSVEARLSKFFILKGGVLREELGSSGVVGGRYNLDLRLNFEY